MALLPKRKRSLVEMAERLDRNRARLAEVEAAIIRAARTRADALAALAEEDVDDPVRLVERRSEISAAENALLAQREALQDAVRTLGGRCAELAVADAEGRVEALRKRLEPLARERSEIEARLFTIAEEEATLAEEIADALDDVRWAASEYDDAAKASAEAARVQERERVVWLARTASRSARESELAGESPRVRRLVEEEMTRAVEESRQRRASGLGAAVETWRPLVRNPEEAPAVIAAALKAE